ncbi:hypothetical protein [Bacillus sonorensis]|nr:hypothetical protein [Bacillus sonorensis]TWK79032.1 hypothetical protein CHCC20335_1970 [Bacillus paralicheniformis]
MSAYYSWITILNEKTDECTTSLRLDASGNPGRPRLGMEPG